jgi:hypothetical protein
MPRFPNIAAACWLAVALPAAAADLPSCADTKVKLPEADRQTTDDHRLFERPVVDYPAGTDPALVDDYLALSVGVDASGRPTCVGGLASEEGLPKIRAQLAAAVSSWRYRPFEREGRAIAVLVQQPIDVQILSGRVAEVPPVRAEDTSVTLVRVGCFWQCAEYAITVRGDGWVGYRGLRHVAVPDDRAWKLPAAEVAPLLALVRDPGLWAAEDDYRAQMHDAETIMVRVDAGGQRKQSLVYPASHPAAPIALRRLAEAIVQRTGVHRWVYLSNETIEALQKESFDFASPAGRDLLVRSFHHRHRLDEAAILRLLELGVSAETAASPEPWTVLDIALRERRAALVEPLIAHGVLMTDGRPDQGKIDAAFRAAIQGGRLAPVQRLWRIAGTQPNPALTYPDPYEEGSSPRRALPVTLLLERDLVDKAWEGFAIARWLEGQGADLSALSSRGTGLLTIAATADDPEFMRYLLARSLDPASLGEREFMRFSVRHGEDMALQVLDAQLAHKPRGWELPSDFLEVAELQDWPRVIAWLEAHPEVAVRAPRKPCPRATQVATKPESSTSAGSRCGAAS